MTENRFGEQGVSALAECLQHNTSLTNLTVDTPTRGGARNVLGLLVAKNIQLQHYKNIAMELKTKNEQLEKEIATLKNH